MKDNIQQTMDKIRLLPPQYRDIAITFIVARFIYSNSILSGNYYPKYRQELLMAAEKWARARNQLIEERCQAIRDTEIIAEKIGNKYYFPDPDLMLQYKKLQGEKR